MKIKKTSLVALFSAVALAAGVTTAFATSAKPDGDAPGAIDTATQVSTVLSYVDPEDGTVYYSFDGGTTFEVMTDEEYDVRFSSVDVEWWTYEGYKEWLENEKVQLQSLIGERAWNSGRGEFVWTQEIVDETVAVYEGILEAIKDGMLYSKMVNGAAEGIVISMNPGDIEAEAELSAFPDIAGEAAETEELLQAYVPFGLSYRIHPVTGELSMSWQGKPVTSIYDAEQGVRIANSLHGSELGPDVDRDLEAVYEGGELIGLQLVPPPVRAAAE